MARKRYIKRIKIDRFCHTSTKMNMSKRGVAKGQPIRLIGGCAIHNHNAQEPTLLSATPG